MGHGATQIPADLSRVRSGGNRLKSAEKSSKGFTMPRSYTAFVARTGT
jgi:hypothetical protein